MAKKFKNLNINANIEGQLKVQNSPTNSDGDFDVLVRNKTTKLTEKVDKSAFGGGGGDNFATADLTLTGDRLHDTDSNNLEFKNNDTKIVLKNIMLDGESVLFAGNIITHVDGSDTIIMYDGIVYKPDFESFMLQQITKNSLITYSERLTEEGQKIIYSPTKSFAIDGELSVVTGGVIFTDAEFLKPPNWTTLGRPVMPEISFMGYNTSDNKMEYWNGSIWVQLPSTQQVDEFTSTTNSTQTTSQSRDATQSYQVYINGLLLPSSGVVSFIGTTLILAAVPLITDVIQVIYYY